MKITKKNSLLKIVNDFLIDSPLPLNISYFWNFGSLLGLNLVILIISGLSLAMHYTPNILLAFASIEHIMRDVNNGWVLRYLHANGASFFFIWVYLHIGRNLFYGSYRAPRTLLWNIGVIIYILMMATAFIGKIYCQIWINNLSNLYIKNELPKGNNIINPIKIYKDLHTIETQLLIKKDNNNKSGIYCIYNSINHKFYIGSAITNRINTRFRNHCIHGSGSSLLKKAIDKYGLNNFEFYILEYFPGIILKENLKKSHIDLLNLETFYILLLNPPYNILTLENNSLGFKHSEETK